MESMAVKAHSQKIKCIFDSTIFDLVLHPIVDAKCGSVRMPTEHECVKCSVYVYLCRFSQRHRDVVERRREHCQTPDASFAIVTVVLAADSSQNEAPF